MARGFRASFFLLPILLAFGLDAFSHERRVVPMFRDPGPIPEEPESAAAESSGSEGAGTPSAEPQRSNPPILVFTSREDHLTFSPATVGFGEVVRYDFRTQNLQVTNVSDRHVNVVAATQVAGLDTGPTAFDLLPGQIETLTLEYSPVHVGAVSGTLDFHVVHEGTSGLPENARVHLESVPVNASVVLGPILEMRIDGEVRHQIDFGWHTRRGLPLEDLPAVPVTFANVGDRTATFDIHLGGAGSMLGGPPCTLGRPGGHFCLVDTDGHELSVQPIPAGEELVMEFRYDPTALGFLEHTFDIHAGGVGPLPVMVTGEAVQALLGPGSEGPAAAGTALKSGDGSEWRPNSVPFDADPLDVFRPQGVDPRSIFHAPGLDRVDLRTGQLTLAVPVAIVAGRGGLAVPLTARYDSKAWSRRTMWDTSSGFACTGGGACLPAVDRLDYANAEFPNPSHNAGFGWILHPLGRLLAPTLVPEPGVPLEFPGLAWQQQEEFIDTGPHYVFVDATGAQHRFSWELNEPTSPHRLRADGLGSYFAKEFLYDRSGSYLRLRRVSATERHVEMPDGRYIVFEVLSGTDPRPSLPDRWIATRIADRKGNEIRIDYSQSDRWVLEDNGVEGAGTEEDSAWRQTTIEFAPGTLRPTRILQPGFQGGDDREVLFSHSPITLVRPITSTFHHNALDPGVVTTVALHRLDSITLPEGDLYSFTYRGDGLLQGASVPTGAR